MILPMLMGGGRQPDPNCVLLLPMKGANNSTTFPDIARGGNAPHAMTAVAAAKIITSQADPWGRSNGVAYMAATGDYVTALDSADWNFGAGDFTIESWAYFLSDTPGDGWCICMQGADTNYAPILISRTSPDLKLLIYASTSGSGWTTTPPNGAVINRDGWHHVAAVVDSGTLRGYVDGTKCIEAANVGTLFDSPYQLNIGHYVYSEGPIAPLEGYLSDFCITRRAKYTANFTPPGRLTPYL